MSTQSLSTPVIGPVKFTTSLIHQQVGATGTNGGNNRGFHTNGSWGNSYDNANARGDVYNQKTASSGATYSITMNLPAHTGAFYFFADPFAGSILNVFPTTLSATNVGLTLFSFSKETSSSKALEGASPARLYEIYATQGDAIKSITIKVEADATTATNSGGFAIGDFGIAHDQGNPPTTPEPASLTLLGLSAVSIGARYAWRRRKRNHAVLI